MKETKMVAAAANAAEGQCRAAFSHRCQNGADNQGQKNRQKPLPEVAQQTVEGVEENADDEQANGP